MPDVSELVRGGGPSRKDRLGRAIVLVSLSAGGYDFADEKKATAKNVRNREYHHVYPKALLVEKHPDHLVNSALNCALISWATNRKIGAKTPKEYISARASDAKATDVQVRYRLESHLIPYDELISGDYLAFLEAKAVLVYSKMKKLTSGHVG